MTPERKGYVNVDELIPALTLEQAASYYGVPLPELRRIGKEIRSRCFLNCGKTKETGDNVLAMEIDHPAKQWKCHEYGCQRSGNFVSLCDLMKGGPDATGRPRGQRFKDIAADLQAMASGIPNDRPSIVATPPPRVEDVKENIQLEKSSNERARALVHLDEKFLTDVATMSPAAASYFRKRPFLSPEVLKSWRVGYLPRNTGGDAAGGTMRGKVVYAYHDANGELLTWFGRDPEFEAKHQQWEARGNVEREPEKFHFVKGFHRGLELFGQDRLRTPEVAETLRALGLILVEGPNDVIRLATLGIPAVALCSNAISREQAAKAAELAIDLAGGVVTIFFDCDSEGERGMKQALGTLAQLLPVRLAWTSKMYGGKFTGRQPESLSAAEWEEIAQHLKRHRAKPPAADPNEWRVV